MEKRSRERKKGKKKKKGHKFSVSSGGGDPLYRCKSERQSEEEAFCTFAMANRKYLKTNTKLVARSDAFEKKVKTFLLPRRWPTFWPDSILQSIFFLLRLTLLRRIAYSVLFFVVVISFIISYYTTVFYSSSSSTSKLFPSASFCALIASSFLLFTDSLPFCPLGLLP